MNSVVAIRGLQVSDTPVSIVGGGNNEREMYMVASKSSKCVVTLVRYQRLNRTGTGGTYSKSLGVQVLRIPQHHVIMRLEVEGTLVAIGVSFKH